MQIQGFSPGILAPDSRLVATGKSSVDLGADLSVLTDSPQRHRTRLKWRGKSREERRRGLSKRRRRPVIGVERGREEWAGGEGKMDGDGLFIFNFSVKSPLIFSPSLALSLPLPHLNVAKF